MKNIIFSLLFLQVISTNFSHAEEGKKEFGTTKYMPLSEVDIPDNIPDYSQDPIPYVCSNGYAIIDETYEDEDGTIVLGRKSSL